jgi:hypothetical protein
VNPRARALVVVLTAGLGLGACAGSSAGDAPAFRARPSPGLRDRPVRVADEAPFAPRPSTPPQYGPRAARIGIDVVQARQAALALAGALLDADAQALSLLLDEHVTLIAEGARKQRREVIATCLGERAARGYRQDRRLDSVVDLTQVVVTPAGAAGVPRPSGVDDSDVLVQLTAAPGTAGSGPRTPCLGTVYVRPGPHARIVALLR